MGTIFSKNKRDAQQQRTDEIIDKYIRLILENKQTNQEILPDFIEKKIYRAVFQILFYELSVSLPKSEFILFDHKITIQVSPLIPDTPEQIVQTVLEIHETTDEKNQSP